MEFDFDNLGIEKFDIESFKKMSRGLMGFCNRDKCKRSSGCSRDESLDFIKRVWYEKDRER